MGEICTDNRFEIIEKVKVDLLTNNTISQDELEVLDGILFSLWQRGYFRLNEQNEQLKQENENLKQENEQLQQKWLDSEYEKSKLVSQIEKMKSLLKEIYKEYGFCELVKIRNDLPLEIQEVIKEIKEE